MDKTDERDVVSGFFPDEETATTAVQELIDRHFDPQEDISIVISQGPGGKVEQREVQDKLEFVDGAKIGGGLGAALGATGGGLLAAGVIGGPVGLLAPGPLLAVLQGALVGGAFGAQDIRRSTGDRQSESCPFTTRPRHLPCRNGSNRDAWPTGPMPTPVSRPAKKHSPSRRQWPASHSPDR